MSEPAAQQPLAFAALVLALAGELVQGVHERVVAAGFDDLRPAHGFAFARISHGGATTAELAEHLGVTKQASAQLVDELVRKGYVERTPHPGDARARLLRLSERGWACTRAADAAAVAAVAPYQEALGAERFAALVRDLGALDPKGPIRPAW
ncbi:MarR family transcriptional regulator [Streptacidiphilus pinicola]|uniref:MarR family transcriptional regulator n=1 Tax=Streptacidiphilus pinicola TaxID=2219663 RepID=A0A2X0K0H0_9ACTN|nr:MarR family transcriptional regulator [Streptacidiphilus pinicola]RAG82765.1 MarR family transcriptional regulator [Streptacidiphilus pinicola]